MKYQDAGRLVAGDHVYIFVPDRYPRLLDRLFASRVDVDPEDAEFFGAFTVDPARPATDLEAAYEIGLGESEARMPIHALVLSRLGGRAEYADRVTIGPIELIVRDVDEDGKITSLGVSFDPAPPAASVPAFLMTPAELAGKLRALFGRLTKRGSGAAETAEPDQPDSYNSRGN